MEFQKDPVLVVGDDKMAFSIAVCLSQAGHVVALYTANKADAFQVIETHFADLNMKPSGILDRNDFEIIDDLRAASGFRMVIVVTAEDVGVKCAAIKSLEEHVHEKALIAINTESIPLSDIQQTATRPDRIIGVNWVEPAHTTYFLEVISNESTPRDRINSFVSVAKTWQKDPYVVNKNMGIRSRMMAAMVREAFYLLENGYVSTADIDRACRNDPGYYLPFSGHCRYMDLMGTYIYGTVMKDLNPELSKDSHVPAFFTEIIQQGGEGMKNNKGFYAYEKDEVEKWDEQFRKFSYEIQHIIHKYPFNYLKAPASAKKKVVSDL